MQFFNDSWRDAPVPGYKVSKDGEVWSHRTKKMLKPYPSKKGYIQVQLAGKTWYLSHLVYYVFKGFKPKRLRYINGDISDCSLANLENISTQLGDVNLEDL
jgi:hypothetical protein